MNLTRFTPPHQLQPADLRQKLLPAKAVCVSMSLGNRGHTARVALGDGEREDGYTCEIHLTTGQPRRWVAILVPRQLECQPLDILAVAYAMGLDYYAVERVRRDSSANPAGFVYATAITAIPKYAAQRANTTAARV